MSQPHLKLAALATENLALKRECEELREKNAVLEKRAEAEKMLVEMIHDTSIPSHLRPSSPEEFLKKRAQIENQDLGTVKLALKMAGNVDFGIGEPESTTHLYAADESKADVMFTDWLLDSES